MSSKSNIHASEETIVSEPQEIGSYVHKMIEPITTVPPTKPKRKPSSTTKKKKPSKSKKGDSKIPLTMTDLYVKENPFESTGVETNVDTCVKDSKDVDAEATSKIAPPTTIFEFEKGNLDETLTSDVPESAKKLGLEDLNVAIDSAENMDVDGPSTAVETNVVDCTAKKSLEKTEVQEDVGPDVGTSLGQHDKQVDDTATIVGDESGFETASGKKFIMVILLLIHPQKRLKRLKCDPRRRTIY
jgi:hypothetical protein